MNEVFLKIVNMSISASYLVAAVLLLRLVLKKAPKWVNVLLWGIVAIRLIFPFSIESALSLIPSAETIPEQVISGPSFEVQTGIPQIDVPVNDYIGDHYFEGVTVPAEQGFQTVSLLTVVWVAGMAGMLVYTAVSYFLLRRKVATAVRLKDNIYQSENVDSPFVLGFLGPKIYLPFRMEDPKLAHVIAHEQAHIQRKDHWWKPFGFVLLALHWFNPIMWVSYILLCRDIELACDEKVIQQMDNETKATYTEALVACSVNRRSIAACPLAFGEVGVKERVKTVMNYKKPAFWIVITAVALCVVVAVCFLTNPKNTKSDVSLLEFPGLKWGMSPEEAKAALNISDDMITREETVESELFLFISGSEYFGEDAESLALRFQSYNNKTELWSVQVTYAQGTDMRMVRDHLIEIYGPGTDYGYTDYEIFHDPVEDTWFLDSYIQFLHTPEIKSGKTIEANAKNPSPPETLHHLWASDVDGTKLFTKEETDIIVELFGDDVGTYADRETTLEYLQKHVWIRINCKDGYTDKFGREYRPHVLFTSEYVNFNRFAYEASLPAVPTEDTTAKSTMSDELPWLYYPDIAWGAMPEDVKENLGVTDDQILTDKAFGKEHILHIKDLTFLGQEVVSGEFRFIRAASGASHLIDVKLYYPENADMATVKDGLTAFYGQPKDGQGFTRYRVTEQGTLESYTDYGVDILQSSGDTPIEAWWESEISLGESLAEQEQNKVISNVLLKYKAGKSWVETVREYLEKEPVNFICCTNRANTDGLDATYCTKNVVYLSSGEWITSVID